MTRCMSVQERLAEEGIDLVAHDAAIRAHVADDRFDLVGSMWVETDCNIPSGESLVRQIVHGRRFFRDEFGVDTPGVWLPDTFGYSAAMPQILRRAGIDWFMTQKLSWTDTNRFPQGVSGQPPSL